MKLFFSSGILIFFSFLTGYSTDRLTDIVVFASVEKSKLILSQEDDYTKRWSPMDIDIRMQKANSAKEELMDYIPTQVRAWSEEEEQLIGSILRSYDQKILDQGVPFEFT